VSGLIGGVQAALSEQIRLLCQNVRTGFRGHLFSCIFPGRSERFDGRYKYLEFYSDNAVEITEGIAHRRRLRNLARRLNPIYSDNAGKIAG
jgi:hypothetical protein